MGFFDGWSFRTSTPKFNDGETVTLYTSGIDPDRQQLFANVGDTRLWIDESSEDLVDRKVTVKITSFDPTSHEGEAELLRVESKTEF